LRSGQSHGWVNIVQADELVVVGEVKQAFEVDFAEVACPDDADF
jgi:hypothetical protein